MHISLIRYHLHWNIRTVLRMRAFLFTAAIFVVCTINIQCTDTAEYYVSSNGALCPDNTICRNLSFYIFQYDQYFTNDTIFNFLEGTHVLEQQLLLPRLQNVTFQGIGNIEQGFDHTVSQSTVILTCKEGIGGVVFLSCENINIKGITINNCSTDYEFYIVHLKASLAIYNSININIENLSIQNSSHNGLVTSNVLNMTVLKCSFARNALEFDGANMLAVFFGVITTLTKTWNVLLKESNITSSLHNGLYVEFLQEQYIVNFVIQSVNFINNKGFNTFFRATSSCQYNLQIDEVVSSGARYISFYSSQYNCSACPSCSKPVINITNSIIEYNYGRAFNLYWQKGLVNIESTRIVGNIGLFDPIAIQQPKEIARNSSTLEVKLSKVTFKDNIIRFSSAKFTVAINGVYDITLTDCIFEDNFGTGLLIYDSSVTFAGRNVFINNTGIEGGAILVINNGYMLLNYESKLSFINNHAVISGGAIHVVQNVRASSCFYQLFEPITESPLGIREYFLFQNNTAHDFGSAVYGGRPPPCFSWAAADYVNSDDFFVNISTFVDQPGYSVISSDTFGVCFCNGNIPNCSETNKIFQISPGDSFTFTATPVGGSNGTTSGVIQAIDQNAIQPKSNFVAAACTNVTHSVQVTNSSLKTIYIYVSIVAGIFEIEPKQIVLVVNIKPCPAGFYLSSETRVCDCIEQIASIAKCVSSTGIIERSGSLWISYDNEYNCTIVDQECPFDYCKFPSVNITLDEPNDQCSFNRIGRLCGGCEENYSVVFGSNKCKKCNSNVQISLLIAFAFTGIALVVFLLILNLTVSVGTINGLIFYANIVKLYEPLFPTEPIPFLSQFISWINLDLGIETCFYKGMNACEKTGLQFIFPFYLWFIIGLIILLARYFSKISKLVGNNATPVLATLLLLSYTKLLRTVILILSTSQISCNGKSQFYWYVDANIAYFRSCHLPLFITAVIVLILLVVPYTLFLLLFPLLEFSNEKYRSKLSFLIKFKPFFDAYGGPYNDKFRFWPGILLLVRVMLALSVGLSDKFGPAFGCLVAIAVILIISLSYGKVYTSTIYVLDIWFKLSLMIMAYIIQGNVSSELSSSNEIEYRLIVILNFGLTFVIFFGVIFYHIYTYSIGQYILQKWYAKIISYKRTNTQSQIVEQLLDVSQENIRRDNVPSTECYAELREPLLEDPFP